jgi:hypothetical protein
MGFNSAQVEKFFELLKEVREKIPIYVRPKAFTTSTNVGHPLSQPNYLLLPKGAKSIVEVVSAERGESTTVARSITACGVYDPAFL